MSNALNSHEVAKWFIGNIPSLASGYLDENIKLNKLLYFSNLMYYCLEEKNLLNEEFVAFPKGPVLRSIYRDYRYNGLGTMPNQTCINGIDKKQKKVLDIISFVYGNKEADELVEETHQHSIWKNVEYLIPNNPRIDFSMTEPELVGFYQNLYRTYTDFDFSDIGKEKINGNLYYYSKSNFEMTDDVVEELSQYEKIGIPQFIEIIDGEIVFS